MNNLVEMLELQDNLDNLINEAISELTVSEFVKLHEAGILQEGKLKQLKRGLNLFKDMLTGKTVKKANATYDRIQASHQINRNAEYMARSASSDKNRVGWKHFDDDELQSNLKYAITRGDRSARRLSDAYAKKDQAEVATALTRLGTAGAVSAGTSGVALDINRREKLKNKNQEALKQAIAKK